MNLEFEKFCKNIANILNVERNEISEECSIIDDIGIDSLKLLDLCSRLEKLYSIKYSVANFIELDTVGELYDYTMELLSKV